MKLGKGSETIICKLKQDRRLRRESNKGSQRLQGARLCSGYTRDSSGLKALGMTPVFGQPRAAVPTQVVWTPRAAVPTQVVWTPRAAVPHPFIKDKGEQRITPLLPSAGTLPQVLRRTCFPSDRSLQRPSGALSELASCAQLPDIIAVLLPFGVNQPGSASAEISRRNGYRQPGRAQRRELIGTLRRDKTTKIVKAGESAT